MNNFELSEEQTMIHDSVSKLIEDITGPVALERDEHRQFVRESVDGLAELGLFGMLVSEDGGGAGLGYLSLLVAVEEAARTCGSTARVLLTQAGLCAAALDGVADGADLLEGVMTGEALTGFVGPESGLLAAENAGTFTVTGGAELVTAGMEATKFLVAATLGDETVLLAVEAEAVQRAATDALGFRAAAPAKVTFDAAAATLLAKGADADAALGRAALAAWIGGAGLACGSAAGSIEHARRHASERIAFGKPLLAQQAVGYKLVESTRRNEAARHQAYHAARLADAGAPDARDAAMLAKLSAVDASVYASDEAIQIHGGYGYVVEYHVERHYRDAKTIEVLDGGLHGLRDALMPA